MQEYQITITEKALFLIKEYLGSDLAKIANEIDKLSLILKNKKEITSKIIEENIGISKDYNVFEFQNALGNRNNIKALKIAQYFSFNSNQNPFSLIVGSLFAFFQTVITYKSLKDKSQRNVSIKLKINPYFINQFEIANKNYNFNQLLIIFNLLSNFDLRNKGIIYTSNSESELLRELTLKILNT